MPPLRPTELPHHQALSRAGVGPRFTSVENPTLLGALVLVGSLPGPSSPGIPNPTLTPTLPRKPHCDRGHVACTFPGRRKHLTPDLEEQGPGSATICFSAF